MTKHDWHYISSQVAVAHEPDGWVILCAAGKKIRLGPATTRDLCRELSDPPPRDTKGSDGLYEFSNIRAMIDGGPNRREPVMHEPVLDLERRCMRVVYDLYAPGEPGQAPAEHPQKIIYALADQVGFQVICGVPQSIGDCWWFWIVYDKKPDLPPYITEANWLPVGSV